MAIRHGVTDTDNHFLIDPITRTIENESGKHVLIQYDHNSERYTFECPRYVEGHDMSLCNKIEVHFVNTSTGNLKSVGIYEADDLHLAPDDSNVVMFSWLIHRNATRYVGKLNFVIRFTCFDDTETNDEYIWNTSIYSDISIDKGIYNVDDYEQWKQEILAILEISDSVTSSSSDIIASSKAVKTAYDKGVEANEKLTEAYNASMFAGQQSSAAHTAATEALGKAAQALQIAQQALDNVGLKFSDLRKYISDSVTSNSSETIASSRAVKEAYDKAASVAKSLKTTQFTFEYDDGTEETISVYIK